MFGDVSFKRASLDEDLELISKLSSENKFDRYPRNYLNFEMIGDLNPTEYHICNVINPLENYCEAVGYFNLETWVEGLPIANVVSMYVRPEFREQGFGNLMLAYANFIAMDRRCVDLVFLDTVSGNQSGIDFLRKRGFKFNNSGLARDVNSRLLEKLD